MDIQMEAGIREPRLRIRREFPPCRGAMGEERRTVDSRPVAGLHHYGHFRMGLVRQAGQGLGPAVPDRIHRAREEEREVDHVGPDRDLPDVGGRRSRIRGLFGRDDEGAGKVCIGLAQGQQISIKKKGVNK